MQDSLGGVQKEFFYMERVLLTRYLNQRTVLKRGQWDSFSEGTFKCQQMENSPSLSKLDVTNKGKIKSTSQDMSLHRKSIGGVFP